MSSSQDSLLPSSQDSLLSSSWDSLLSSSWDSLLSSSRFLAGIQVFLFCPPIRKDPSGTEPWIPPRSS